MITKYIMLTVEYIEKNLRVEVIGAIVILTLIIVATLGILFLLFRGVRLWYWRVNEQVAALEKINQKLEKLEDLNQVIPSLAAPQPILYEESKDFEEEAVLLSKTDNEDHQEIEQPENQAALQPDVLDLLVCEEKKEGYNVGKTGKVYSENELRQQIQF
ncbi:hypothetical protein [Clostridium aminobutyricum]|uniref:Uncharacterized protein n=1 Tax=Clostridium aminobutyricum TaxID=33953 RepID=A0A939IH65_CLOAM|nr:hypothetical protein [Clostridium aminobutyricum]MBN7773232.1 hypothetical protein [Clostridium aminobutyricum]